MTKIWDALDIMKKGGWYRGADTGTGGTCMNTALSGVHDNQLSCESEFWTDVWAVEEVCREQYPEVAVNPPKSLSNIWDVNDSPDRTFDEIEVIMTKAATRREGW